LFTFGHDALEASPSVVPQGEAGEGREDVKAISLRQPWAEMIADGIKTIETRTWSTSYRGPLLIVSSKTPDRAAIGAWPQYCDLIGGAAVCECELVDCRPMTAADEEAACCASEPGRFAWIIRNVHRVPIQPVKGQLGLYDVELKP
jgi:hypothetical protein